MAVHRVEHRQYVDRPIDEVFAFFAEAHNLERSTPGWLSFEVLTPEPVRMAVGTLIDYRLRLHGVPLGWTSQIEVWEPERQFVDRQVRGPYGLWHHRHRFETAGDGTIVIDEVHYAVAFGAVGELADRLSVSHDLKRIFAFRHQAVQDALGDRAPVR